MLDVQHKLEKKFTMPFIDSALMSIMKLTTWFSYPRSLEKTAIDDNRSLWASYTADYQPNPPLTQDIEVDVAIIGGGYTGVSTAYHLSQRLPDVRIAIIEAKKLANGASGRNGGMLLNRLHESEFVDDETYAAIYHATNKQIDDIVNIIERNKLDVFHKRNGSLQVWTKPQSAEWAQEEVERCQRIGIPYSYLEPDELRQIINLQGDLCGAVYDPNEGMLNGAQYVRAVKSLIEARGVQIYENTMVTDMMPGKTVELQTPQGKVKAGAVVLATNGYTGKLGHFRKGHFPLHSHVIGTAPLTDEQVAEIGWGDVAGFSDDLNRLAYCVLTPDNRIVFGGGSNRSYAYLFGNKTAFNGDARPGIESMKAVMYRYMPTLRGVEITHEWTGTLAITLARNSTVGVQGEHGNIYYGLGYSGHGVTMANLSGRIIADIYAGDADKWRDMPFFNGKLMDIPLDPFRWVGYQLFTHVLGRSPRVEMEH